jgi:ABC-type multidrug transport system ATPase subunit
MVVKPEVLLLDEPTANLDPKSASAIDDLIERLAHGGTTVIIASHNMTECRRLADKIVVLVNGRINRTGRPNDIQPDNRQYLGFLESLETSYKV